MHASCTTTFAEWGSGVCLTSLVGIFCFLGLSCCLWCHLVGRCRGEKADDGFPSGRLVLSNFLSSLCSCLSDLLARVLGLVSARHFGLGRLSPMQLMRCLRIVQLLCLRSRIDRELRNLTIFRALLRSQCLLRASSFRAFFSVLHSTYLWPSYNLVTACASLPCDILWPSSKPMIRLTSFWATPAPFAQLPSSR